jgi:hypothetical protein
VDRRDCGGAKRYAGTGRFGQRCERIKRSCFDGQSPYVWMSQNGSAGGGVVSP